MLRKCSESAKAWLWDAFFPLWSTAGVDNHGAFAEALSPDGKAAPGDRSRTRVQSRQTFCFSFAYEMGWSPKVSEELTRMGVRTLLENCRRKDGLFGKSMYYQGGLADENFDLYDNAFALFALSSAARALNDDLLKNEAIAFGRLINDKLKRQPPERGYSEYIPKSQTQVQAQNPHMHLLEAFQALARLTGAQAEIETTKSLTIFCQQTFIDITQNRLHELSSLTPDSAEDDRFEAGHHYEWVWLLDAQSRLCDASFTDLRQALYKGAQQLTNEDGRIFLSHDLNGVPREAIHRVWTQTEALKAHLVEYANGAPEAKMLAKRSFDLLFSDHLSANGGWIEHLNVDLSPINGPMPASTGYHVCLAFKELFLHAQSDA